MRITSCKTGTDTLGGRPVYVCRRDYTAPDADDEVRGAQLTSINFHFPPKDGKVLFLAAGFRGPEALREEGTWLRIAHTLRFY